MYLISRMWINGSLLGWSTITYFLVLFINFTPYHQNSVFGLPSPEMHSLNSRTPAEEFDLHMDDDEKRWLSSNIDAAAESLQKCVQYPGMSVAAVKLGDAGSDPMVLTRHYGVMDVESQRPVQEDTKYCVGSLTKAFIAALLVQLLKENGSYTLDTSVQSILGPDFQLITSELTEKTTIRDILAHRVGIAQYFGAHVLGYNFTRQELVRRLRHIPALKQFRSSFVPNNFLYTVAGLLAEKINGSSWESQTLNKILKPLGMDQTRFADKVADWNANFALPHALENGQLKVLRAKVTGNILRPLGASSTLCTSARDMAKWMLMHLQNGLAQNGQQVLHDDVIGQLFDIQNRFPKPIIVSKGHSDIEHTATGASLAWLPGWYRGTRIIYHDGMINYYFSLITLLPEKGIAVFSAMNGPHMFKCDSGLRALHYYIMDSMMGERTWFNASNICSFITSAEMGGAVVEQSSSFSSKTPLISTTISSLDTTMRQSTLNAFHRDGDSKSTVTLLNLFTSTPNNELSSLGITSENAPTITSSSHSLKSQLRTIKLKKRRRKTTTRPTSTTTVAADTTTTSENKECDINCRSPSTPSDLSHFSSSTDSTFSVGTNDPITTFSWLTTTESTTSLIKHHQDLSTSDLPTSSISTIYGTRLRAKVRPLRRRRPRRHAQLIEHFKQYIGTYSNPFFGEIIININRTVPALQLNYGYYGRALLEPKTKSHVFQTHYFNSIWYQSESDDMKLYAKLGILDVQFGNIDKESLPKKLVVFQFDPDKPPIFTRIN